MYHHDFNSKLLYGHFFFTTGYISFHIKSLSIHIKKWVHWSCLGAYRRMSFQDEILRNMLNSSKFPSSTTCIPATWTAMVGLQKKKNKTVLQRQRFVIKMSWLCTSNAIKILYIFLKISNCFNESASLHHYQQAVKINSGFEIWNLKLQEILKFW